MYSLNSLSMFLFNSFVLSMKLRGFLVSLCSCVFLGVWGLSCSDLGAHDDHVDANVNYAAAYVVNGYSNTLSVIRLSDFVESAVISLHGAQYPHHIAYDSVHNRLAVAITGMDLSGGHEHGEVMIPGLKIMILDATSGRIEKEIACERMPHNAVFMRSGSELWFGQADSARSEVLVYSTSDWTLLHSIPVGAGLSEVSVAANNTYVFAANTDDATISVINPTSYSVSTTIPVGLTPVGAWPAANGRIYVDNERGKSISEINVDSLRVVSTIACGFTPAYAVYVPSGELWVSDADAGRIVYYRPVNNEWSQAGSIATGANAHAIALNKDASLAFITNQGAGTVSVINTASHTVTATVRVGSLPNGIVICD
mgnify:CR=1 FL=1